MTGEQVDYRALYEQLLVKMETLTKENEEISEKWRKHKETASLSFKKHYEKNREKMIENVKEYNKKKAYDPVKTSEYNKRSYERKKLKKIQEQLDQEQVD